jgi:hypothetical protein
MDALSFGLGACTGAIGMIVFLGVLALRIEKAAAGKVDVQQD